jgi:hypothetical protein
MVLERVPGGKRWGGAAWVPAVVGVAVLAAACAGTGFQFVSSSDRRAFFKVPVNWELYDKRDILVASGQSLSAESNRQLPWLIGFDADPNPSVEHVVDIAAAPRYPVVMARVQQLPFQVRDALSLSTLRNWVYPIDRLLQANAGEILAYEDVVLPGGFHGSRIVFDVVLSGISNVSAGNQVIRVQQIAVVDPATQRLYFFMIRCESHCYRDNGTLIDQIASSWTVKER